MQQNEPVSCAFCYFCKLKVKDLEEQHVCAKFFMKFVVTFTETFQMLKQAYGEAEWRKRPEGVEKQNLDVAPWQCTNSHFVPRSWIFGKAWDDCHPLTTPPSIFGLCSLFFFPPEIKIHSEKFPISDDCRDGKKFRDLHTIPQNVFHDTFQDWKKCWKQCMDSGREYFEGDMCT
jgi:hypothetical protein